jgi:hypothetical protein
VAILETLRFEGEMLAVKFVPNAVSPADVEQAILDQVRRCATTTRTAEDYDQALLSTARRVKILMKACSHITALSKANRACQDCEEGR